MEDTKKFEHELPNGVSYEVHVAQGFSGRSEIAIKIGGQIASVLIVEKKRTGNIVCKPMPGRTIGIKKEELAEESVSPPNVDDVLETESEGEDTGAENP